MSPTHRDEAGLELARELVIEGGAALRGAVAPSGYKHAMVLAVAAAVLCASEVRLRCPPRTEEARVLCEILEHLGGRTCWDGPDLVLDTAPLERWSVPPRLSTAIHGSVYLVPALLGRFGRVVFGGGGGDAIGSPTHGGARPMQHMLEVLEAFGARFERRADGLFEGHAAALVCDELDIMHWSDDPHVLAGPLVSGATKTALLAALSSERPTVIRNPHDKEAAHDLLGLAARAGALVERRPEGWVVERPLTRGAPVEHSVMPDPTEVMTWIAAATFTRSPLTIGPFETTAVRAALRYEAPAFERMGLALRWHEHALEVGVPDELRAVDVESEVRGISTDNHPFFALMLTSATGPSRVTDLVWRHRFDYTRGLVQLGADLHVEPPSVHIRPSRLHRGGQLLTPQDTRATAVAILGALVVEGITRVRGLSHLHRGYVRFPEQLRALGARIHDGDAA